MLKICTVTTGRRRVLVLLLVPLLILVAAFYGLSWSELGTRRPATVNFAAVGKEGGDTSKLRFCTVDELLPLERAPNSTVSTEWSRGNDAVEPPYGCNCASAKGRYFCPSRLGGGAYPKWEPRAITEGACRRRRSSEGRVAAGASPFPPGFKVLFYGNSYMRQVVEAILCLFEKSLVSKRVRFTSPLPSPPQPPPPPPPSAAETNGRKKQRQLQQIEDEERTVPGAEPCRACSKFAIIRDTLLDSGCIAAGDDEACRCNDDAGEFLFANGAVAHFFFAHDQPDKSLSDALAAHGGDRAGFSQYDAVFANQGNDPPLAAGSVLDAAFELRDLGVPFFWLSTYEGKGGPKDWVTPRGQSSSAFLASGAKFVRVGDMAHGLDGLTLKGAEGLERHDPHFCLPGVPDEIGLLLLELAWASLYEEQGP